MSSKRIQKIKEQILEALEEEKPFSNLVGGFISILIGTKMRLKKTKWAVREYKK